MLETILADGFEKLGISADANAISRFRVYFEYLEEINKVMNLTAISGEEDVARLHFLDCAAVLREADVKNKRIIDVGTGAGFPGLALKIVCPDMKLTLLDSLDKRINFLKDTCAKLKESYRLNFGVYYTPAENLCYTAMKKFKDKWGIIPNVSDRDYFTNSMHIPV